MCPQIEIPLPPTCTRARTPLPPHTQVHRPDAVTFVSQEVYRAALFAVFFVEVLLASAIPRIGRRLGCGRRLMGCVWLSKQASTERHPSPSTATVGHQPPSSHPPTHQQTHTCLLLAGPALNFVLLSWLYALYCFDYKWSLHGVQLQQRVAYFERHWAFFLGGCTSVGGCGSFDTAAML